MKHLKKFNESDGSMLTKPGFAEKRMAQQKEYESKYTISIPVPVSAYELLKNKGVADDKIVAAYTEYVKHSLGLTYGTDLEEFRTWCEKSDNLVDFQEEYLEEPNFKQDKDSWWDENYQRLINACDEIQYEDWKVLIKHRGDFEGVYNSTSKHRAIYLLNTYSIEELEGIISDYTFEDDEE